MTSAHSSRAHWTTTENANSNRLQDERTNLCNFSQNYSAFKHQNHRSFTNNNNTCWSIITNDSLENKNL